MPFVTVGDGTEIFYKDWGDGQPIVSVGLRLALSALIGLDRAARPPRPTPVVQADSPTSAASSTIPTPPVDAVLAENLSVFGPSSRLSAALSCSAALERGPASVAGAAES